MEKLDYPAVIKKVLEKYVSYQPKDESVEKQLIFDTERNRYLIVYVGWDDEKQIYRSRSQSNIVGRVGKNISRKANIITS